MLSCTLCAPAVHLDGQGPWVPGALWTTWPKGPSGPVQNGSILGYVTFWISPFS